MSNQLTGKQQKFIDAYLGEANCNAYKAAKIAGYKGNGKTLRAVASRLLTYANIKSEIAAHFEANAMGREELLSLLGKQARSKNIISRYLRPDGIDLESMLADGHGNLIKSMKPGKYGMIVEFVDDLKSQELIGRHLGLFEKIQTNLNVDLSDLSDEQLEKLINGEGIDTTSD
jgi:hypothetical protein